MEKEKMEIEKMLEEIKEMLQKSAQEKIKAKVNVIVKGNESEVEIEGTFLGMLIAITNIVQSVNERMREKGMDEKEVKKALESAFKEGMDKRVVKFLLEHSFYSGMEETDE